MATTQNVDIAGMVRRARRFKYEWGKSSSGNASFVKDADAKRLQSYIEGMFAYIDWVQAQPILDLPEYHGGNLIDLGEGEALAKPENEAIVDMMQLWDLLEGELVHCQSSRMAVRLLAPDEVRVRAILSKMRNFLEGYIAEIQPLDLPESSPLRAGVGAGRKGLNP